MNQTKEEYIELNITSTIIIASTFFLGIILHWIFFLIGIIAVGIQRYYTTNEKEVNKWIQENLTRNKKSKPDNRKIEIRK